MSTAPPAPARRVPSTGGVTLALHDLGGDGPPVLLCHPTGFLAMTWAPLAHCLAGAARCLAHDFRGHGDSTAPASGDLAWSGMADDVLAVVDALAAAGGPAATGGAPAAGGLRAAGHSMGGAALLMAEQRRPGTFTRLWLYEPIVGPVPDGRGPRRDAIAAAAARRRPWFPDRAAAYANFASKPPLDRLAPEALRLYVDHGLRGVPGGDGAVALKCTPETEASVFRSEPGDDTYARLGEVRCPVTVAAGGDEAGPARLAPLVAARLPRGRLERHPALAHLGPMEDPPAMARAVAEALDLA